MTLINDRHSAPIIKAQALVAIHLARKDIEESCTFFQDFGLTIATQTNKTAYLSSLKSKHHCVIIHEATKDAYLGCSVLAPSQESLEVLARTFKKEIVKCEDERGGECVKLTDPDGLLVEVVWGLNELTPNSYENDQRFNSAYSKVKSRINEAVSIEVKPSPIQKLGHTVHSAARLLETVSWYQETLGMIITDYQVMEKDDIPLLCFMRFDLGDKPTDHHSIAIGSMLEVGHEHTAFEVESLDEIAAGGEWLKQKGYRHSWGIGRHKLGSQIFDYWRDPSGFKVEHYADGDVFDATHSARSHSFNKQSQHHWGPSISKDFTGPALNVDFLTKLIKRLMSDDDLTLARLGRIKSASESTD